MAGSLLPACALLMCVCDHWPPPAQHGLVVDGRTIEVEPGVGRDFPGFPSREKPLVLLVELRAPDSLPLPQGLAATHAWVVHGSAVWETDLIPSPDTTGRPACETSCYAGGGPDWGPDMAVDVTVRVVQPGRGEWYILVPGILITKFN